MNVMSYLNVVIYNNTIFNNRISKCTTIYGGTRTYFDIVANYNATKLMNLDPAPLILSKTETIRADNGTTVNRNKVTQDNTVVDTDIASNSTAFANHDVVIDNGTCANPGVGSNRYPFANHR